MTSRKRQHSTHAPSLRGSRSHLSSHAFHEPSQEDLSSINRRSPLFLFPPSAASQLSSHANRRNLPPPPPQPPQQHRWTTPPPPLLQFAYQPNASIGALCFWSLAALLLLLPPPLALGQKLSDDGLFYCSLPESNLAVSYCGGDYPSRTSASLGPPDDKVFAMLDKSAAAATKTLVASYGCSEEQCKVATLVYGSLHCNTGSCIRLYVLCLFRRRVIVSRQRLDL
jgi:hypothetical protein